MIIQMAISRSREYEADRIGAEIAGNPLALASALAKIEGGVAHIPNPDAERHPATAPLFIINPLSGHGMDNLFSTHPATENRIAALQALAQSDGLGRAPGRHRSSTPRDRAAGLAPARTLGLGHGADRQPEDPVASDGLGARRVAWKTVEEVLRRRVPLDDVIDAHRPRRNLSDRDESLARAIAIVTFRRFGTIRTALAERLDQGLPKDQRLLTLLAIGAAQILFLDVPDHAAVDTAVRIAGGDRSLRPMCGLINAVLRRVARERVSILAEPIPGGIRPTG